tara:strand:+ start:12414 stop:12629 length:216 start_codon:yes stop_codon:yes gene_type:complete
MEQEQEVVYILENLATGKVVGEVYVKQIFNFNCVECDGWWSIVDPPALDIVYCPWCSKPHQIKVINRRKNK